ncbi:MAG: thrombospondin type 3 repeat-containing protein [Planctomycetota bacterium]|jgi:hypothetical protein
MNDNDHSKRARARRVSSPAMLLIIGLLTLAPGMALGQDSDSDGLDDATELALAGGTGCPDPANPDSDGDGLTDGTEVNVQLTDPCNEDTDDDGLRDDWEINGVPYVDIGGTPQLYSTGVGSARRKDLYVEIDAMVGEVPSGAAMASVILAFATSPVPNPDGSSGITLNLVLDDVNMPSATWTYNPGGGVFWPPEFSLAKTGLFGTSVERADPSWWVGSTSGPMREAKRKMYRYCIFAKQLGSTSISGLAELPGNDMMVTLGAPAWTRAFTVAQTIQPGWANQVVAGAFMHELGHMLGLGHGGPTTVASIGNAYNFKPNYFSVMNYSWPFPRYVSGLNPNPTAAQAAYASSWSLDYSDSAWPMLNEQSLTESTAICSGACGSSPPQVVPVGPPGPWGWGWLDATAQAVDYNRNGVIDAGILGIDPLRDINWVIGTMCSLPPEDFSPPPCPHLADNNWPGADDWSNLRYEIGGTSAFANGGNVVDAAHLPTDREPSFEDVRMLGFLGSCMHDDDFEPYDPFTDLHGHGGWKGFDDDPVFSAPVTSERARSGDQSVQVGGAADLVHEFCADDFGAWSYSAWQYIPTDFESGGAGSTAGSYFILLNTYQDGIHVPSDWSTQLQFDGNDEQLKVFHGDGTNTINVPYETDRWVKIQAIVDLEDDWTRVYYDGDLVTEYSWTGGVLGDGGGALDIAAVDLYANGSTSVFYDDLVLEPIKSDCGNDLDVDVDGDLLTLLEEFLNGTNPCEPDSDFDGWFDDLDNCPLLPNPDQLDLDGDGVGEVCDNCPQEPNPEQTDSDGDGIGDACTPPCEGDVDGDGLVGVNDLLALLLAWGTFDPEVDMTGDGFVDVNDLLVVILGWGSC